MEPALLLGMVFWGLLEKLVLQYFILLDFQVPGEALSINPLQEKTWKAAALTAVLLLRPFPIVGIQITQLESTLRHNPPRHCLDKARRAQLTNLTLTASDAISKALVSDSGFLHVSYLLLGHRATFCFIH